MPSNNETDSRSPEPTVLALAPCLDELTAELRSLVKQLDRLYEQRYFELQQKYGQQAFLDFKLNPPPRSS